MRIKRRLGSLILVWYLASSFLAGISPIERNTVSAHENNLNTSTQLIAVLVNEKIYPSIEGKLRWYTTKYLQKQYPQSKALVFKINPETYTAPEISKLLENVYFDGLKDQSSRLIWLVLIWDLPLPVVRYQDYIFPSIYPYVDFLEQKYIWDEKSGYFTKNADEGQAEVWHGMINFGQDRIAYNKFFNKLEEYDMTKPLFVEKKIWYDDFIALKKNSLEEIYHQYINKLLFSEDLMYHRYTNFLLNLLQGEGDKQQSEILGELSKSLWELGITNPSLNTSIQSFKEGKKDITPTRLLEQKLKSFIKSYHEVPSSQLLNTISENIKASDRRDGADSHHQKLHLKDQLLLGDMKINGLFKKLNDELERFVDQKVEKEKYAMKTTIPTFYHHQKYEKKRIKGRTYTLPEIDNRHQFFYFGRDAQTISNAEDFSIFRGTFRNLTWFVPYSQIIWDPFNPAKDSKDKTDLTRKGLGASYDLFSQQTEGNRGFNVLNMESEYELYQKEKTHAKIETHCTRRWFGLKWKWVPCARREWKPVWVCKPGSPEPKDHADCETFSDFGKRVWGGATPLNIDTDKLQQQIYGFSGYYDPRSAWKPIFDIAGSVSVGKNQEEAISFKGWKSYSSPTQITWKEGAYKDPIYHTIPLDQVRYFNVPLEDKIFTPLSSSTFSLLKPKAHNLDHQFTYQYKIIDSKIKHDATRADQINGYSGFSYDEGSEASSYIKLLKEVFVLPEEKDSKKLSAVLQSLLSQLSNLKTSFLKAQGNASAIAALLPDAFQQDTKLLLKGQHQAWSDFNLFISKNHGALLEQTLEQLHLRHFKSEGKIWIPPSEYQDFQKQFNTFEQLLKAKKTDAENIFNLYYNIGTLVKELFEIQAEGMSQSQGTGSEAAIAKEREALAWRLSLLRNTIAGVSESESCENLHADLASLLAKEEQSIKRNSCNEDSENDKAEENFFDTMLSDLTKAKQNFSQLFISAQASPLLISGMNLLTPDRPIDSPRYLSFQGVGENPIKLIYPNLFKIEVYKDGAVAELKNTKELRLAIEKYFKNKVEEYNLILEQEKKQAKPLTPHYEKLTLIDKLATPLLDIRPYEPFTYKEFLEAVGGQKMINTLAELLYYQSISNQLRTIYDEIDKDLDELRKTFDINEKIGHTVGEYLGQDKRPFYEWEKNAYTDLILPKYYEKGYEVAYINSDHDDTVIYGESSDSFLGRTVKNSASETSTSAEDANEIHDVNKECWFNIEDGLLLYNFETKNADWREGFQCWLDNVKKKPFELKLSFEGSWGAAPFKENIEKELISPLAHTRDEYQKEFKPAIAFHELPKITSSQDQELQKLLNSTQTTLLNKRISVAHGTGAFSFLSLKDYGNLHLKISSTGDNCLIINGKNSCQTPINFAKNPFKSWFVLPFHLEKSQAGSITTHLQLCTQAWTCRTKLMSLSAVPAPLHHFQLGLPKDKKLLAGAYILLPVQAFDLYNNLITRSLDPYVIEASKWHFIVKWHQAKQQEISDFENTQLLYRAEPGSSGVVQFTIKNKKGEVLLKNTAEIIQGKLYLEQKGKAISLLEHTLNEEPLFLGQTQTNPNQLLPLNLTLKDSNGRPLELTTQVLFGTKKGLADLVILQSRWAKETPKIKPVSWLFIEKGSTQIYVNPKHQSGEEMLRFLIPGLPEQEIKLHIHPGPLAQIDFEFQKTKLDPGNTLQGELLLSDQWGNLLEKTTRVQLNKIWPLEVEPRWNLAVSQGKQILTLRATQKSGPSTLYAEGIWKNGTIQAKSDFSTKKLFLDSAIGSGLNVMYLNLFGSDRGNQRGIQSEHEQFSERIIKQSDKTLAITTQLIDPKKVKKAALLFHKNGRVENINTFKIKAIQEKGKLTLNVQNVGTFQLLDSLKKVKVITHDSDDEYLEKALKEEQEKVVLLYDLNPQFLYQKGNFLTREGTPIGKLGKEVVFEWTEEILFGKQVWNVVAQWHILAKAVFVHTDFSQVTGNISNPDYEFAPLFTQWSTHSLSKALFSTKEVLSEQYEGYDSIQNSHELEKYIGFRGNFKNITAFAGGQSVGEATLPFGSEFLINIWDPALKRIEPNTNLRSADYNQGLGKVVYSSPWKPIFKTLDLDYNNDGLRDLLILYKDGTVSLQKQYQDKKFQDMGVLLLSAEPVKEAFVGDVDGNGFEDLIIRNTQEQLRVYTNENWIFDVDGKLACLNTNVTLWAIQENPSSLTGVHQLFIKDMDLDKKIDIVTLDHKGYLKVFYGKGKVENHSYLSKESSHCDAKWYTRQKDSYKTLKHLGIQLTKKAVRDESLIRRDGLYYPTQADIAASLNAKTNREKGIETDPILLGKLEDPELIAPCVKLDYECKRNAYGEQFCKKYWRYNACKWCTPPVWPLPNEPVCTLEYREMDRPNDDQRIRGKPTYEDGMCWLPPVPTCFFDGKEEDGRLDAKSKHEIVSGNESFDFLDTAQEGVGSFDKYVKNPFTHLKAFEKEENWAFIPINKLETPLDRPLGDKVRDVSKRYTDLNGWNLEDGDIVEVEVVIINKKAQFSSWAWFFDKIQGPWLIEHEDGKKIPKAFKIHAGDAHIEWKTKEYAYYLTNLSFDAKNELIYTYQMKYHMKDPLFKISIEDIASQDYKKPGFSKDKLPDVILSPKDACVKKQEVLFNENKGEKRSYQGEVIDLQALAHSDARVIKEKKENAEQEVKQDIKATQSVASLSKMPGLDTIQESFPIKDMLGEMRDAIKSGNGQLPSLSIEAFEKTLDKVENKVQDIADKMCKGFSFWFSSLKSCDGLPVPFNQAFLAPGKYHLMGCIPMEPLTRTLGKGIPVFHFPGTLQTPVGSIPIPWGLKGPGDGFLRAPGGSYPSRIRIYAAPTLTAQVGLAICFGPYSVGTKLPSPFADIGGNCIVTSFPLPCWKKDSDENEIQIENTPSSVYPSRGADYAKSGVCKFATPDSPFTMVASSEKKAKSSPIKSQGIVADESWYGTLFPEGSYLWGLVNLDYDSITSEYDKEQNDLTIDGIKIQGIKDLKNTIIWAKQQGIQAKLVGRFDKQMQYWVNNLLRFRVEFIFPDMNHLKDQISTFNFKELWKLTWEGIWETTKRLKETLHNYRKSGMIKTIGKNTRDRLSSKEQLTALNLANGDNPFEKLKNFFNSKELVHVSSQTINVKVPWIYSEDIEAYKNYLLTWWETNKEVLDAWSKMITASFLSCEKELEEIAANKKTEKKAECKALQDAKTQIMQMTSKFDTTSEQIFENIQILEQYKRFPLEIYEWMHVSDRYLGELSALISKFFGYINYWMDVNANRFSQYVDTITTIIGVVKTYQVMVDLFVDRGKKCWKCTQDSYDQYACKLSFLCPDLPIIPIPSVKIPSLYIDLSHLNLEMDIVLPRLNFVPESIELPRLANFPEPPQLGTKFSIDFWIPDLPLLPEPPTLPELPSFIPQVKMQLPILPPAPKIPELPRKISQMVSVAKKLSKIYCIIKSGIGLVGENAVKARIEQMTQRSYEVPWVDRLDLTHYFKQTPLQGIDLQVDSFVNLQYNFDGFYALLKSLVENVNQSTMEVVSQAQNLSDQISEAQDQATQELNDLTNQNVELNADIKITAREQLYYQVKDLEKQLSSPQEQEKLTPILQLAREQAKIEKNHVGLKNIEDQLNTLLTQEKNALHHQAELAKNDYTQFLKTLEKKEKPSPIQLSFSTSLLQSEKDLEAKIEGKNPTEMLITTEAKRLDGYLLALQKHSAQDLNMKPESYEQSKAYLQAIKSKLGQRNALRSSSYAGTQTLISKSGKTSDKTLLTQVGSSRPASYEQATHDLSSFIKGVLVRDHQRNLVNVVHSKHNYEQFPSYYQQDMNNDGSPEVITWDQYTVYIKYAHDAETKLNQQHKNYYLITPNLKNKAKKYETLKGGRFGKDQSLKVYDENWEVKNFKLWGQTFDALNFSRSHDPHQPIDGYLMRVAERVDGLLEKASTHTDKYLLFLPRGTDLEKLKLRLEGQNLDVKNQLGKRIYEVLYYPPASETLHFNLHEVPRKWQYLQITSLKADEEVYTQNAPWSNQIVWGRQLVGDEEAPVAKVELIRTKKGITVDEGLDLEGMVGSYYDLKVTRKDNAKVCPAWIKEGESLIAEQEINAPEGSLIIKDLFFTKEEERSYEIGAKDCQGNAAEEKVQLQIGIPQIHITDIEQYSGWREGIENPILIHSELETDIDQGDVSFQRKRNQDIKNLTSLQKGQNIQTYPVRTNQTKVTGAYYDFWELIGLYTQKKQLIATVNGKNGEILIKAPFQKTTSLGVDFSKGYPVVKVLQGQQALFEILLTSEQLIETKIIKGQLFPLSGKSYGAFDGGQALLLGKEAVLYISPEGLLWTNKPLRASYHFDPQKQLVSYKIFEHRFGEELAQISFKVKAL